MQKLPPDWGGSRWNCPVEDRLLTGTYAVALQRDRAVDFARFCVTADRLLREHQLTIDRNIKDPTLAGNQRPRTDKRFQFAVAENFVRQPDGAFGVVSGCAVFDTNFEQAKLHHSLPLLHSSTPQL